MKQVCHGFHISSGVNNVMVRMKKEEEVWVLRLTKGSDVWVSQTFTSFHLPGLQSTLDGNYDNINILLSGPEICRSQIV